MKRSYCTKFHQKNATDQAELTIKSELSGQFYSKNSRFKRKQSWT
jgi:hypothetical protein